MLTNEFFQQSVLGLGLIDQCGLDGAMHGQVVPGRHARQVGVDLGRQVSVRPEKSHHGLRSLLQNLPVLITARHMAQQNRVHPFLSGGFVLQLQRQMRHIGQALVVTTDQAGKRIRAHQGHSVPGPFAFEMCGQVHTLMSRQS